MNLRLISIVVVFGFCSLNRPCDAAERSRVGPLDRFIMPRHYICYQAKTPPVIDGKLNDKSWAKVPWTDDFVDIEGDRKPKPQFRTRVKMLWDKDYFYIAAELEEPHIWGTLTKHDSVIFHDNDFEVFLDPDGDNHNYGEFEINALNTGWDLRLRKPYKDGGKADNGWEITGLKTAVHIDGTLNNASDADRKWTVEIAFPWKVLGKLSDRPAPPKDGDQWRVNFSRVEWRHTIQNGKYQKIPKTPEDNWVWSPQGVINMHRPENWGYVQFSTAPVGKSKFRPDPGTKARYLLHQIYYAQREFRRKNKRWAQSLSELSIGERSDKSIAETITMQLTNTGFTATATVKVRKRKSMRLQIGENSRLISP